MRLFHQAARKDGAEVVPHATPIGGASAAKPSAAGSGAGEGRQVQRALNPTRQCTLCGRGAGGWRWRRRKPAAHGGG